MQERKGEQRKNIIEQNEEIKDNEELIEKLQQKLKRWRIFNAIEFCIFLAIILYSCSAGIEQHTVAPPNTDTVSSNGVSTSDEPDSSSDGTYSITVDKINIGVNKDYSNEDTELYKAISEGRNLTRGEARELYYQFNLQTNTYYIKSSENVFAETYSEAGNSITVDSSLGLNDFDFTDAGGYDVYFVADDCTQGVEPYSDGIVGYLMWKDHPKDTHCEEGVSFVFVYNTESVDKDVIAQTVVDNITNLQIPVGANRTSLEMYGAEESTADIDGYYFLSQMKPIFDSKWGTSKFYIADDFAGNIKGFAFLSDNSNDENRATCYDNSECILTANDETPNIHAVIINIDGFAAESWYCGGGAGNIEEAIKDATSEGYHN